MFDFRYHVASLAAVFLALVIGILVGVGISGRGLVEESERRNLNERIDDLERQLQAQGQGHEAAEALVDAAYAAVMDGRLRDRRIALVFVGSVDPQIRATVVRAVAEAGGETVRVRAVDVPVDPQALSATLRRRPSLAGYAGEERLGRLGAELGEELVTGGETPLWDALASQLVEERSGAGRPPAHGVVVVRTANPQQGPTARFLHGLYAGLQRSIPVVGVETTNEEATAIDVYKRSGLSSVDNVDGRVGQIALVMLLAGGQSGHYGVKPTAEAPLPPIEPLAPAAG